MDSCCPQNAVASLWFLLILTEENKVKSQDTLEPWWKQQRCGFEWEMFSTDSHISPQLAVPYRRKYVTALALAHFLFWSLCFFCADPMWPRSFLSLLPWNATQCLPEYYVDSNLWIKCQNRVFLSCFRSQQPLFGMSLFARCQVRPRSGQQIQLLRKIKDSSRQLSLGPQRSGSQQSQKS